MKNVEFMSLKAKGLMILFGFLVSTSLTVCGQTTKRNVLFIAVDDLNDYISLLQNYPGLKTPNLDKFAKTALNFNKSYCPAPICNPSRTALLSGIDPTRSGVYENEDRIQDSRVILNAAFLPEHFQANGYVTLTRGKIFHTVPPKQRYDAMWNEDGGKGNYGPYATERNVPASAKAPVNFNFQEWTGPETDHPDNVTADFTIDHLNKTYDKPFFMAVGLYKPHNPWTSPKRFFDMYPLESVVLPKVLESDWDDLPEIARKWAASPANFEALKQSGQWKSLVRSYLACISFMDWNFGRIIDALDKSRYKDNTIITLFADNGFHLGEKKHFAKFALWEKTTHVLHMWRVPGVTIPGSTSSRTVNLLDIFPTLIELCKLTTPPQQIDGRSLVTLLKDPATKWDYPSVTTYKEGNQSIRTEKYRYIRYSDGEEELYDEVSDPDEWKNLAKQAAMKQVIESFRKQVQTRYAPAVSPKIKSATE